MLSYFPSDPAMGFAVLLVVGTLIVAVVVLSGRTVHTVHLTCGTDLTSSQAVRTALIQLRSVEMTCTGPDSFRVTRKRGLILPVIGAVAFFPVGVLLLTPFLSPPEELSVVLIPAGDGAAGQIRVDGSSRKVDLQELSHALAPLIIGEPALV